MPSSDEAALSCWEEGGTLYSSGDYAAATHYFREAVRIDPEFGEAFVGLGACLGQQHLWTDCAAAHRRALELLPDDFDASYNLGVALGTLQEYGEAEKHLRHALSLRNDDLATQWRLGYVLAQQVDDACAEALQLFEAVLAADPESVDAYVMAARELALFGRQDEARAALERALLLEPNVFQGAPEVEALWESLGGALNKD